jgi:hypothetical protein
VLVLVILFVGSGIAYVLISGRSDNNTKSQQSATAAKTDVNYSLPKPPKPAPNAPESAAVEALMSPVSAGANTSVTVKTIAGSSCAILVTYNNVPAKDSGLTTKLADDYGNVTWAWTVDKTAPLGTWPVKVTCTYNKKSAVVIGNLQVTK